MTAAAASPSTLQTVVTNLMSSLAATPTLANVDVSWEGPSESAPDEVIAFTAERAEITSASIGQQKRWEEYDLVVIISVLQSDPNQFAPLQRAFALRDAIAAIVRADATIGGAVTWALDQGWDVNDRSDGNRSESQVTMHIHCKARI